MKIKLKNPLEFQELLLRKGFTQRAFGRAIGVAESYACQIANGERNPGPGVAKKICEVLEVEFDDIFFIMHACKSKNYPDLTSSLDATGTG
ncbi:MAG: helix-turn-helix transcriptional regulator [Desulfotomaculales bacterium]